jgi:spermidine synthase
MKPWRIIARTRTPEGSELTLTEHPSEYLIHVDGQILMSSRMHASEDALAVLGCRAAETLPAPRVLVGGLGMGFTLRAALDRLPAAATVVVAELVPAVVEWNRGPLGPLAGYPLDDPRVRLEIGDVAETLRQNPRGFDAVLIDVDNGSEALTIRANAGLYDDRGIALLAAALAPGGILAVWSADDDRRFERRLRAWGFDVRRERLGRKANAGGRRHTILVARGVAGE